MITIVRNFEGMRARVSTDDGEHSEWLDIYPAGAAARLRAVTVTVQRVFGCLRYTSHWYASGETEPS